MRIAGAVYIWLIYTELDRLVFFSDGEQRAVGQQRTGSLSAGALSWWLVKGLGSTNWPTG